MCHPSIIRSRQLRRYNGGNTWKSQDYCEGLRVLPLKAMECEICFGRGFKFQGVTGSLSTWLQTNVLCQGAYRTFSADCSWNPRIVDDDGTRATPPPTPIRGTTTA